MLTKKNLCIKYIINSVYKIFILIFTYLLSNIIIICRKTNNFESSYFGSVTTNPLILGLGVGSKEDGEQTRTFLNIFAIACICEPQFPNHNILFQTQKTR